MRSIELRELAENLIPVLLQVRAGEDVLVTDDGEIVAELRSPRASAGLYQLAVQGRLTLGGPNRPDLYQLSGPRLPEGTAARLLDEDRADRVD